MNAERIWAYVHGEAGKQEADEIDRLRRADADFRQEVERIRSADKILKTLMPFTLLDQEQLAERIMAACEAQPVRDTPARKRVRPFIVMLPHLWERLRAPACWRVALPLAACLLIMLGLPRYVGGPLAWEQPEWVALRYRGAAQPHVVPGGVPSRDEAAACVAALKASVQATYRKLDVEAGRRTWLRFPQWDLKAVVGQLPGQMFSLRVNATDRRGHTVMEWSQSYASRAAFSAEVDTLAAQIAGDLARLERERAKSEW